jgi:formamidopyrimidine-DNA glycosylase
LGPEPLLPEFTIQGFQKALAGRGASIKALLLNQKVVAGLGNIYVDEALFRARVAPATRGGRLTKSQITRLHAAIRAVLTEAVRYRGTTLSDYFDPESRRGGFQNRLKVYGREGEPCVECGTPISKGVLAQRGTHWCGKCQKNRK